jgi:hypothetical protein
MNERVSLESRVREPNGARAVAAWNAARIHVERLPRLPRQEFFVLRGHESRSTVFPLSEQLPCTDADEKDVP